MVDSTFFLVNSSSLSDKSLNKTEGIFDFSISEGHERNIEGICCLVSVKSFEEGDFLILG